MEENNQRVRSSSSSSSSSTSSSSSSSSRSSLFSSSSSSSSPSSKEIAQDGTIETQNNAKRTSNEIDKNNENDNENIRVDDNDMSHLLSLSTVTTRHMIRRHTNTTASITTTSTKPLDTTAKITSFNNQKNNNTTSNDTLANPKSKNKKKNRTTKGKKRAKKERPNDWQCSYCGMIQSLGGSDLIMCDGPCLKSYHAECLMKMRIDYQGNKWFCPDCEDLFHECFICKMKGHDYIDVYKCSSPFCGKFYHINCLMTGKDFVKVKITSKNEMIRGNVAWILKEKYHYKLIPKEQWKKSIFSPPSTQSSINLPADQPTNDQIEEKLILKNYHFTCPRHLCDSCSHEYPLDTAQIFPCIYCPRGFHSRCIPPYTKCNEYCLVCVNHPNELLPGDAKEILSYVLLDEQEDQEENNNFGDVMEKTDDCDDNNQPQKKKRKPLDEKEKEEFQRIQVFCNALVIPQFFTCSKDEDVTRYRLPFSYLSEIDPEYEEKMIQLISHIQ